MIMKILSSILLMVVVLGTGIRAQQCTIGGFQSRVLDLLQSTEANDATLTFSVNRTIFNCLSTSQTIGFYNSMSVSILYIRSDAINQFREVRYNLQCSGNSWSRAGQQSTALVSSDNRLNCSDCTDQAVNDYHCTG